MARETEDKKMSQTASDRGLKTESHKEVPPLLSLLTSFCLWRGGGEHLLLSLPSCLCLTYSLVTCGWLSGDEPEQSVREATCTCWGNLHSPITPVGLFLSA